MSKASTKQRYEQLIEWLAVRKTSPKTTNNQRSFSKADTYNKSRNYGNKKSN